MPEHPEIRIVPKSQALDEHQASKVKVSEVQHATVADRELEPAEVLGFWERLTEKLPVFTLIAQVPPAEWLDALRYPNQYFTGLPGYEGSRAQVQPLLRSMLNLAV